MGTRSHTRLDERTPTSPSMLMPSAASGSEDRRKPLSRPAPRPADPFPPAISGKAAASRPFFVAGEGEDIVRSSFPGRDLYADNGDASPIPG